MHIIKPVFQFRHGRRNEICIKVNLKRKVWTAGCSLEAQPYLKVKQIWNNVIKLSNEINLNIIMQDTF